MPQQKYLCIQRSLPGDHPRPTPAQMQEMYARFHAWMTKYRDNLTDLGGKLGSGTTVDSQGVKDGPFAESKEVIGGYMVITAQSLDEAIAVVRECPGVVMPGSSVEIREIHQS